MYAPTKERIEHRLNVHRAVAKSAEMKPERPVVIRSKERPTAVQVPRSGPTSDIVQDAKRRVLPVLMKSLDLSAAASLTRQELSADIDGATNEILRDLGLRLCATERMELTIALLDEMVGLGPLEPLVADDTVTDIMVNGPGAVYVERAGRIELSDVRFIDHEHIRNVAVRIASSVGRRVDESVPMCDARLPDGSRVNIIIPPLALKGPTISIRKFRRQPFTLDTLVSCGAMSPAMSTLLQVAARSRLNILISGGTGSGKTTLLNAMSATIDPRERIITIEDAAELQLQQPHVIPLETRPPNIEGNGAVTARDLLRNSLRMRPDRIIVGEVRSDEVIDMLQAMNTGHDGSMATIHASKPRDALIRVENMIGLTALGLPIRAIRTQLAAAIDLIVQMARLQDGVRRVTHITEIVGMEEDTVLTQDLFRLAVDGSTTDARLSTRFEPTGLAPKMAEKARLHGLESVLIRAVQSSPHASEAAVTRM